MKILTVVLLVLIVMSGQLNANNHSAAKNKIKLKLTDTSAVSVKGYIAPIENTGSDFHVRWDALANLRVAEPEKQHPTSVFQSFLPTKLVSVGELWALDATGVLALLRQLHPKPNLFMHINSGDSYGLWGCLRALQRAIRRHCVSDSRRVQTRRWVVYAIAVYRTSGDRPNRGEGRFL